MIPAYPVAVFPNKSLAVTEKVPAVPAVIDEGKPESMKVLAAAGFTVTVALPVIELLRVSVAVTDRLPAVTRVTPLVKVCTPLSPATKV